MQITPNQNKAAGEIVELIANNIGENRAIHPATAISTCSRLSGSFLFRSFNIELKDAKPGSAVLSEQANTEGPKLVNIVAAVLHNFGISLDAKKMEVATIGKSNLEFLEAMQKCQSKAFEIMKNNNLNHVEMAQACAMSTAFVIEQCKNDLQIENGFQTAGYGIVEGSKTVPPTTGSGPIEKKKWYQFW